MRVSVDKQDAAYNPNHIHFEVYLDGKKLTNCVTADEETGEAFCYAMKDGKLDVVNDALVVERLTGSVKLKEVKWTS